MATSGKVWEWHNNEVGVGYQARHVVRQKALPSATGQIIDMRGPVPKTLRSLAAGCSEMNVAHRLKDDGKRIKRKSDTDTLKTKRRDSLDPSLVSDAPDDVKKAKKKHRDHADKKRHKKSKDHKDKKGSKKKDRKKD
jgi:hypothetical protein